MVDQELLSRKLSYLLNDLDHLQEYEELTKYEFEQDRTKRLVIERLLERISNRLIDVAFHVLSEESDTSPIDYYEAIFELTEMLEDLESSPREWAAIAGLRNRLAHEYNSLDDEKVYEGFQKVLEQLPSYITELRERFITPDDE